MKKKYEKPEIKEIKMDNIIQLYGMSDPPGNGHHNGHGWGIIMAMEMVTGGVMVKIHMDVIVLLNHHLEIVLLNNLKTYSYGHY